MTLFSSWKKWVLIGCASIIILLIIFTAFKPMQPPQGTPAPNFTLKGLRGETLSLSNFKGKVVVLEFMATWCTYCKDEVKHLKDLSEEYSTKDVTIIMISVDPEFDKPEILQQYAEQYAITWSVARGTANMDRDYGVRVLPTLVIIDKNGYIRARFDGLTATSTLSKEVSKLLSEK